MDTNILILPGGSRYSNYWAKDLQRNLDAIFQFVYVHQYWHWGQTDDKNLDIYREAGRIKEWANDVDHNFIVVAYQEGVIAALKAIADNYILPKACVFLSYPYTWTKHMKLDDDAKDWLRKLEMNTLFIHAQYDPFLEFDRLDDYVANYVENKTLQQVYGSDSNYDNVYELSQIIEKFSREYAVH